MTAQPRLLDHPFYRAWMNGVVPVGTLAAYHRSYDEFIRRIPLYWQRVVDAFQPEFPGAHPVVEEERHHVLLWERWGCHLPQEAGYPRLTPLFDALDSMNPSELLGALQSLEIQQPEVAQTKKEGLLRHYAIPEESLAYFDEHMNEERHIAYGRMLADRFADSGGFTRGFSRGAELLYRSLDPFVTPAQGE